MSKRSNGEGSSYRRADGMYVRVLSYTDGVTGQRKRRYLYGRTSKEAARKFNEAKVRRDSGAPVRDASRILDDWSRQWLNSSLLASSRKDSTKSLYRSLLKTHVIGQPIGAITMNRLKPTDIEIWAVRLQDRLASASIHKVFHVLRMCLDDAVRDQLIACNPVRLVKPPTIVREEVRHLSPEELEFLFQALRGSQYEGIVSLIAVTGLRKGEAIALRWVDVDFQRMTLRVAYTLSGFGPTEPKTKKSRRTLPMSDYVAALLRAQREKQLEERSKADNMWTDTDYVFTSATGTPLDPRNTLRAVVDAAARVGLHHVNVHTLRHTVATMMLEAGVHDKGVADILGHSDTRMTASYTHTSDRYARDAMAGIAAKVGTVAARVAANDS